MSKNQVKKIKKQNDRNPRLYIFDNFTFSFDNEIIPKG